MQRVATNGRQIDFALEFLNHAEREVKWVAPHGHFFFLTTSGANTRRVAMNGRPDGA
jgi:hypothetical protein